MTKYPNFFLKVQSTKSLKYMLQYIRTRTSKKQFKEGKNLMKSSEITFGFHLMKEEKLKYEVNEDEPVGSFLKRISKHNLRYSELLLDQKGELNKNIMIIINDHVVPYKKRFSTLLQSGDHLEILFLVKGG